MGYATSPYRGQRRVRTRSALRCKSDTVGINPKPRMTHQVGRQGSRPVDSKSGELERVPGVVRIPSRRRLDTTRAAARGSTPSHAPRRARRAAPTDRRGRAAIHRSRADPSRFPTPRFRALVAQAARTRVGRCSRSLSITHEIVPGVQRADACDRGGRRCQSYGSSDNASASRIECSTLGRWLRPSSARRARIAASPRIRPSAIAARTRCSDSRDAR